MSLMTKLFRNSGDSRPADDDDPPANAKSRNGARRDLIRVALRECMRKNGIPSDWMDCRALSVVTRSQKPGMHVQFLVHKGDHQLLTWVHAFQESFWDEVLRSDPHARDWLFSVGWEFYGKSAEGFHTMPDATSWKKEGPDTVIMEDEREPHDAGDTLPPEEADEHDALATDLQALQQMMSMPSELVNLPEAEPRKHKL